MSMLDHIVEKANEALATGRVIDLGTGNAQTMRGRRTEARRALRAAGFSDADEIAILPPPARRP